MLVATKLDEYVPTITPKIMQTANERTSPVARIASGMTARSVVTLLKVVLESELFTP